MHWLLFLFYLFPIFAEWPKVTYSFSTEPIDVVIPCVPKDLLTLEHCIEGIKKNGKNLRRIIVLSKEPMTLSAEWFSEDLFPFSKKEIALEIYQNEELANEFLSSPKSRAGWIFQQLLKLYTPFTIPGISSNVLMLDSDVIFLKEVAFMTPEGEPYFIPAKEYHIPYFEHAARLLPELRRVNAAESGVSHHMLFQKPVLEDLFQLIRERHEREPWKALCRVIDHKEILRSSMSEYEIYFNFIQLRSNQAHINRAKWIELPNMRVLSHYNRKGDLVFFACPEWLRKLYE